MQYAVRDIACISYVNVGKCAMYVEWCIHTYVCTCNLFFISYTLYM